MFASQRDILTALNVQAWRCTLVPKLLSIEAFKPQGAVELNHGIIHICGVHAGAQIECFVVWNDQSVIGCIVSEYRG